MTSTTLIDGKEQHTRWCIPARDLEPRGQPIYCRGAEGLVNNHCCYIDYCNSIDLKLPTGTTGLHTKVSTSWTTGPEKEEDLY